MTKQEQDVMLRLASVVRSYQRNLEHWSMDPEAVETTGHFKPLEKEALRRLCLPQCHNALRDFEKLGLK